MTLSMSSASRRNMSTSILRGLLLLIAQIPALKSHPLVGRPHSTTMRVSGGPDKNPQSSRFWIYMVVSIALVLLGGMFAGLTLGLMGQDEIYLQVIEQSGEPKERKHARGVLRLLKRGKHWVLVTLLLSNVITNETLPIVLDRALGGGWPAVLSSTVLIVIFGEIIPQSVCVRYGLSIGAYLSPFVLFLMYLMYPVAYPTALLLDWVLGEDHGTTYKKSGLKTLVTLHKTLGPTPADRLNQDEVTIISAVLDLKDKPVGNIMTPMEDVFTMDADTVLDEETMDNILNAGYSRIPIHAPGEPTNFIGMLLVKMLITYDPEDAFKVSHFSLATLPETAPETSCLDIVNFFQEGKSHMVLVSDFPGENYGALGVVTLEDVIEELIGEEIIDESDVYIDVHKAIRRLNPAPIARRTLTSHMVPQDKMSDQAATAAANEVAEVVAEAEYHLSRPSEEAPRRKSEELLRRKSVEVDANGKRLFPPKRKLSSGNLPPALAESLRHLGPSNLASNPKKTASKTVKIKAGTHADDQGKTTVSVSSPAKQKRNVSFAEHSTPPSAAAAAARNSKQQQVNVFDDDDEHAASGEGGDSSAGAINIPALQPSKSSSSINSKDSTKSGSPSERSFTRVKTGSLIEISKEIGGIKKVIVEATSSSDSEGSRESVSRSPSSSGDNLTMSKQGEGGEPSNGKKRRKKKKKGKKQDGKEGGGEYKDDEEDGDDAHEGSSLLGKK